MRKASRRLGRPTHSSQGGIRLDVKPRTYFLFCRRFQQRLDSCEQGPRLLKASGREAEASAWSSALRLLEIQWELWVNMVKAAGAALAEVRAGE